MLLHTLLVRYISGRNPYKEQNGFLANLRQASTSDRSRTHLSLDKVYFDARFRFVYSVVITCCKRQDRLKDASLNNCTTAGCRRIVYKSAGPRLPLPS